MQGCPIQCKGCFNQAFWSYSRGNLVCADDITDRILATKDIDGVTFSGGEPFAQADALASVGEQVQEAGYTVVTYTGYTFEQLTSSADPASSRLLNVTDLLIAGPYIRAQACNHPYIGSSNQQLISLTERVCTDFVNEQTDSEIIEFSITPRGVITTTGFPQENMVPQDCYPLQGNVISFHISAVFELPSGTVKH